MSKSWQLKEKLNLSTFLLTRKGINTPSLVNKSIHNIPDACI